MQQPEPKHFCEGDSREIKAGQQGLAPAAVQKQQQQQQQQQQQETPVSILALVFFRWQHMLGHGAGHQEAEAGPMPQG